MTPRLLPSVLLRAPLLPWRGFAEAEDALTGSAMGRQGLALAGADAAKGGGWRRARARWGRRAAFRPTPAGLWAGVTLGALGDATSVSLGEPRAFVTLRWAELANLGRAALERVEVREATRLRRAPSLFVRADVLHWLASLGAGPSEAGPVIESAVREPVIDAVVGATAAWTPWPRVRAAARRADPRASADEIDELLVALVDAGLLHHDLTPPLVGAEPLAWMTRRMAKLGARAAAAEIASLRALAAACAQGDVGGALKLAASFAGERPLHAVLVHHAQGACTLARAGVQRAAELAPWLFRLQAALAPPAAERDADGALGGLAASVVEVHGAGAYALGDLAFEGFGVPWRAAESVGAEASAHVARTLAVRGAETLARGQTELALRVSDLEGLLPSGVDDPPPTFEMFLAPTADPAGAGWLLGLHAPAGATLGRFAHALGAEGVTALHAIARAEAEARPDEEALDVAFAPTPDVADVVAHPPVRPRALAVSSWPDAGEAVEPAACEVVLDPAAREPATLRALPTRPPQRTRRGPGGASAPVRPSAWHRVRSSMAPPGPLRLLAGWSLWRQHAPWALPLGAWAGDARTPRVTLEGFVIAPASWPIPDFGASGGAAALGRWRRIEQVPRFVQVGEEDELLPVDLDAPDATEDLRDHARVFEVWPPLGESVDAGGRRLEAVAFVVNEPDDDERAAASLAAQATARAGRVRAPAERAKAANTAKAARAARRASSWTWKLFGPTERQDAVLMAAVRPTVAAARRAGEIDGWSFLRYVDGPGERPHLRVRVHAATRAGAWRFAARLEAACDAALAAGDVVTLEAAAYQPEEARFGGGKAMPAVEACAEASSELAVAVIDAAVDRVDATVAVLDALAGGLGVPAAAREELADRRRIAHGADADDREIGAVYRERQRTLMDLLRGPGAWPEALAVAFATHADALRRALRATRPAWRRLVTPALLHLACNRLLGPDPELEATCYGLWARTRRGLGRRS